MLYILRGTLFPLYDQDSDILIVKPANPQLFVTELSKAIANISMGYRVLYNEKRHLIQVYKGSAHGDIWMYQETRNLGVQTLTLYDYTNAVPNIEYSWIFPARTMKWQGLQIRVAAQSDLIAQALFGDDYMTPRWHRIQCLENLATNKIAVYRMAGYVLLLVLANWIAISIKKIAGRNKRRLDVIARNTASFLVATGPMQLIQRLSGSKSAGNITLPVPTDMNDQEYLLSHDSL
eukprot:CAMPEP_0197025420 /NCGR_PEP_ID=MMETSP1384-20130603/5770_1 /TAXON_ID=29189 /ORGANISM="Ammonia sp." /LENGTH=233 /DNA_ID=CAMNT_0042453949 /DNA_START=323 /DNA_END=1024 /DNA_ORIENTATION=+